MCRGLEDFSSASFGASRFNRLASLTASQNKLGTEEQQMTKRWIGLVPCASVVVLALSCGSSDGGGAGGSSGLGGNAGASGGSGGSTAGADQRAGAAGEPETHDSAGASGSGGASLAGEGGGGADAGAGGSAGVPIVVDTSPLSPAAVSDLAFWMDGNAPSFSDLDENYLTPPDSGRVRNVREAPPLTGSWQAPSSAERPFRELGALSIKPIESPTGYYLQDTAGTIQTDDSTLAISFTPLNGPGSSAHGGISGQITDSSQALGVFFAGNGIGLYFNHTSINLKKTLSRGLHTTMIVRFSAVGVDVQYDINGLRTSESIAATIDHETASNFILGYDSHNTADMYGFVSQAVGVNRAVSDEEASRLMTWLTAQPIPDAFPVSKPLVAILGDSIANGDQVAQWQSWAYSMLADLSATTTPDLQLLNAATNGSGIPKVQNSDYSDFVLPWYAASRAKNVLIVASGTNDLASGNNLSDLMDRYYALLDSARATGWKTVACTILPRSNPGMASGLAGFESARTAFNADVVAHWASHADALADVAAINGMGAVGDSDNTTYYSADKIHPIVAGHALLEPVYRAAVASQL